MIATTHVGSFLRTDELVPLLLACDRGETFDRVEFDETVQAAIDAVIDKQIESGVTFASDGELGKVGYSTYMTERLSGFGGGVPRKPARHLEEAAGTKGRG